MSKNEIRSVPQLMLVEGRHVTQELDSSEIRGSKSRDGRKSSARKSRQKSSRESRTSSGRGGTKSEIKLANEMLGLETNVVPLNSTRSNEDSPRQSVKQHSTVVPVTNNPDKSSAPDLTTVNTNVTMASTDVQSVTPTIELTQSSFVDNANDVKAQATSENTLKDAPDVTSAVDAAPQPAVAEGDKKDEVVTDTPSSAKNETAVEQGMPGGETKESEQTSEGLSKDDAQKVDEAEGRTPATESSVSDELQERDKAVSQSQAETPEATTKDNTNENNAGQNAEVDVNDAPDDGPGESAGVEENVSANNAGAQDQQEQCDKSTEEVVEKEPLVADQTTVEGQMVAAEGQIIVESEEQATVEDQSQIVADDEGKITTEGDGLTITDTERDKTSTGGDLDRPKNTNSPVNTNENIEVESLSGNENANNNKTDDPDESQNDDTSTHIDAQTALNETSNEQTSSFVVNESESKFEDQYRSNDSLFDVDGALDDLNLDKMESRIEEEVTQLMSKESRERVELVDRLSRMSGYQVRHHGTAFSISVYSHMLSITLNFSTVAS